MTRQTPSPAIASVGQPDDAVRPPPGIGRGVFPVPAWVVALVAVAMFLSIVLYFSLRVVVRRSSAKRRRVSESVAPPSSRK